MRKNLKSERENANFVQTEVAKMLGIGTRQYQALEAGTSDGSIKVWQKLRQLYGKSIDFLLEQESNAGAATLESTKKPDGNPADVCVR